MNDISLGRIFGFPVILQPSALFVLAYYVYVDTRRSGDFEITAAILTGVVLFGSILVHELGHAFVARAYRLGPIDITLHGFGGFTRFGRQPPARQGILVTLAGPFSSIALGLVALVLTYVVDVGGANRFLAAAATLNIFLGLFNLLPMYPLDGGLLTWHGLSLFIPKDRALRWAARLGVLVAVAVGTFAGLYGYTMMALIAVMALMSSFPLALEPSGRR